MPGINPPYHRWEHEVSEKSTGLVLPDGCRDILQISAPGRDARVELTSLDTRPRRTQLAVGTRLTGYRLGPGATVDPATFADFARSGAAPAELIDHISTMHHGTRAAIAMFGATAMPPPRVARLIGVSLRTLQRRFARLGLPAPEFWRLLGRARRAAAACGSDLPLAEVAASHGYADQAHMTREIMRWFGYTPAQLRKNHALVAEFLQPGLGTWTGEQISIK